MDDRQFGRRAAELVLAYDRCARMFDPEDVIRSCVENLVDHINLLHDSDDSRTRKAASTVWREKADDANVSLGSDLDEIVLATYRRQHNGATIKV